MLRRETSGRGEKLDIAIGRPFLGWRPAKHTRTVRADSGAKEAVQTAILEPKDVAASSHPRSRRTVLVLLASDVLAIVAATMVVLLASLTIFDASEMLFLTRMLPMLLALPLGFALIGLYPAAGIGPVEEMRRILSLVTAFSATLLAFAGVAFDLTWVTFAPVGIVWGGLMVLVPTGRAWVRHLLARESWWGVPAIVLGGSQTAALVITRLRENPGLDLKVVGCLDDDPRKIGTYVAGVQVTGTLADVAAYRRDQGVNYAIVAMPGVEPWQMSSLVQWLGTTFANIVVIPNAFGMTSIGVSTRDSGGVVGIHVRGHLSLPRNLIVKRIVDLVLLIPLGIAALPIILLCATAVAIVSPGNPFYRQEREGYRGRRFRIWKLRTMRKDADAYLARYFESHDEARREWQTHFKLAKDPRILPFVGGFLRRSSLDELPQILNIARGQLSFVGPRPFPYYHLQQFDSNFRHLRSSVVPGLTGYWQVTTRSDADLVAQVELDSFYIKNWSLWLDLYIIARTPWAVLKGPGAY